MLRLAKSAVLVLLFLFSNSAQAQKATERFIPIGKSPGLSGKYTVIGAIDSMSVQAMQLTVSDSAGSYTIRMTEKTNIWLDRSAMQKPNEVGALTDLKAGARVEVKFMDREKRDVAEWVKVEVKQ